MKPRWRQRGSVMITVLIFAAVISVALTSYVKLATNAYQLAQRAYLDTAVFSLTETGLEQGFSAFSQVGTVGSTAAFADWTTNADGTATLSLGSFDLGNGVAGSVKVYATGWNGTVLTPTIVARATITPLNGPGLTRYASVNLKKQTPFVGLLSTGNLTVNTLYSKFSAWNSLPNGAGGLSVPYSDSIAIPACYIGIVGGGSATFQNANIYGEIESDSGAANIQHGGMSTLSNNVGGNGWDNKLIASNVSMKPTVPVVPALPVTYNVVSSAITQSTTFPRSGDLAAVDGSYHYNFTNGANINLNAFGGKIAVAAGKKCVFYMQGGSGSNVINIGLFAGFSIGSGGSLAIYTDGNINCTGLTGFSNANNSSTSFIVYGTNPTVGGQSINVFGLSAMIGSIDAPNADVSWTGLNFWLGSVIAHNITFSLAGGFIYDTAMAQVVNGNASVWGVSQWAELTSDTQRAAVAGLFAF